MKIGFKNLRSLKDTGLHEIKPLTLLLGQNSSGKSTFLRAFPLMRQSVEIKTKGPILWYGSYVDFGDFKTALWDKSNSEDFIEFSFDLDIKKGLETRWFIGGINSFLNKMKSHRKFLINLKVKSDKQGATYASEVNIYFNDFKIDIKIDNNSTAEIFVDGLKIKRENLKAFNLSNGLIPQMIETSKERMSIADYNFLMKDIEEIINKISNINYARDTISRILFNLNFDSNELFFKSLRGDNQPAKFKKGIDKLENDCNLIKEFKSLVIASCLPMFLYSLDSHLTDVFKSVSYIAPVRAIAERYYRPQELNIDEIDFQGKNLALVLANLSENEKLKFKDFCLKNFNFFPEAILNGGNISIYVNFIDNKDLTTLRHNITDLGFGFSQLLPIITQIWMSIYKNINHKLKGTNKIFVIEQPELHLHPKLQNKFIDSLINVISFCDEKKYNIQFIIETHSETIINCIGNRIYTKKIDADSINILLFERKDDFTQIIKSGYSEEGLLINWPFGFFE